MKLSKQVAPLVKEWCDLLLFCNYQTYVVTTETNKQKAQGGKRVMYTSHHPAWDAKSRVELPPVLDLDYKTIAHIFERKAASAANASQNSTVPKTDAADFPTRLHRNDCFGTHPCCASCACGKCAERLSC